MPSRKNSEAIAHSPVGTLAEKAGASKRGPRAVRPSDASGDGGTGVIAAPPPRKPTALRASAASLNKIEHTKLGKQAADHLRRQILEGRLRPGQTLPSEVEMMSLFNISRPTLREAMRILENQGLIVVYRGKKGGAEVTHPPVAVTAVNAAIYLQANKATFLELQQARMCIEPELILLLKGKLKKRDVQALRDLLDDASRAVDFPERYARAITAYHAALFALLGNRVLNLIASVLHNVYEPMVAGHITAYGAEMRRQTLEQNLRQQHKLLDLLEAGDFEQASTFCRQNLMRIGKILVQAGAGEQVIDSHAEQF